MKKEVVLGILQDNGFVLDEEKSLPYGVQFTFRNGSKVSVYDKGTVTPQGQHIDEVKSLLGLSAPNAAIPSAVTKGVRKKYSLCMVTTLILVPNLKLCYVAGN